MVSGEKRNCEEDNVLEKVNTLLLDIEGTTTSISFVKETLFPYVRENLKTYIDSHWDDDEFKTDLNSLKLQAKKDEEDKIDNFCPIEDGENEKETVIKNVLWQMDLDRKTTALKQLQGHIWREGYENGKLKGHVYEDVPQMFKKWFEEGRKLYIFSSGSVEAQKLLFKNSESGDLQEYLAGYFDTEIGPKTDASSYTSIAKSIGCDANLILFMTDIVKEAVAADKSGMQVVLVIREGNTPLTDDEKKAFTTITSFKDLVFESSNKKKKICEGENDEITKTENVEKTDEAVEPKNGESEKMDVESKDNEDCVAETKTEENGQSKTESTTKSSEVDSDNIDVDVDDSNVENGTQKVVSSSVDSTEEKNGVAEHTTENSLKMEEDASKEENVDSTNKVTTPVTEAPSENKDKQNEVGNEENSTKTDNKEDKSVNGHENGDNKEEIGGEVNSELNGKVEREVEMLPVKKVTPEEQADSTVEVTA